MPVPTLADVLLQVTDFIGERSLREDERDNWVTGTTTGGPNNDGLYPLTNASGVTKLFPSPMKLASQMLRGRDAVIDISIYAQGVFPPNEELGGVLYVGEATVIDLARSKARVLASSLTQKIFSVLKNGSPWGTLTFPGGSNIGTFSFSNPAIAGNDLVTLVAPSNYDPLFQTLYSTLAGSI